MFKFESLISPDNHSSIWSYDYTLQEYLNLLAYSGLTEDSTFGGLTVKWVNEFEWEENSFESVTLIYEFSTTNEVVYLAITGAYGSLNGLEIDDGYVEVFSKQVTKTIYTTIDGVAVL
jgi:hypothetical protein